MHSGWGQHARANFASLVSVYGQSVGVVRLELMDNAKESEIGVAKRLLEVVTSTPTLAQSLPLSFSLDALPTQVETLDLLEARHCHYLVSLKANQKKLYDQMRSLLHHATPLSQTTHTETLHGQQTQRTVQVYHVPDDLPQRWAKAGITRIVWVIRQGTRAGKPFAEEQCYLSNLCLDATIFLDLTRSHWQIENGLHWVKDVTLQEDDPPRRGGYAPISWAIFNSVSDYLSPSFRVPNDPRLHPRTRQSGASGFSLANLKPPCPSAKKGGFVLLIFNLAMSY
ncbi:MAG: ISAs1 family transposase, partial [Phormidesmis priestleyi]